MIDPRPLSDTELLKAAHECRLAMKDDALDMNSFMNIQVQLGSYEIEIEDRGLPFEDQPPPVYHYPKRRKVRGY